MTAVEFDWLIFYNLQEDLLVINSEFDTFTIASEVKRETTASMLQFKYPFSPAQASCNQGPLAHRAQPTPHFRSCTQQRFRQMISKVDPIIFSMTRPAPLIHSCKALEDRGPANVVAQNSSTKIDLCNDRQNTTNRIHHERLPPWAAHGRSTQLQICTYLKWWHERTHLIGSSNF